MKLLLLVSILLAATAWRTHPSSGTKPRGVTLSSVALTAVRKNILLGRRRDNNTTTSTPRWVAPVDDEEGLGEQKGDFRSGFVGIIGNPNMGKSTLLNALLGEKLSIVSPKPQTTRHRILGILTAPTHQVIFSDTPGMLVPHYQLQEAMMDSVRGAVSDADVVVLVTDVFGEPLHDARVRDALPLTDRPVLVVVNKVDLVDASVASSTRSNDTMGLTSLRRRGSAEGARAPRVKEGEEDYSVPRPYEELVRLWTSRLPRATVLGVSAAHAFNVTALRDLIIARLPPGPKYFPDDTLTTRDERFFASEIVREALFHSYQDEVPYSCEVVIASFVDKSPGLSIIEAHVIVSCRSSLMLYCDAC
jgi:GTP-binding protein Era